MITPLLMLRRDDAICKEYSQYSARLTRKTVYDAISRICDDEMVWRFHLNTYHTAMLQPLALPSHDET